MAYFFFKNFRNQTRWLNRNIWFQFDQTRFYSNFTTDFVSRFCLKIICISLIDILGTIHRIIYYLKISEIECDWVEGEKIWFRFVRKGNKKIEWGNDWFRKQGFFIHRSIKSHRTCDNTLRKNLYLAIYYLQLERGEGGRKRATVAAEHSRDIKVWSTDEASAQHFIATYAIKRSKSFLNATYFLFWNIIFLLTAQCQSFATFVSISRLADNHQQFHDSNFTHLLSFR